MHEGDSSLIRFGRETDTHATYAITIAKWWLSIINVTRQTAIIHSLFCSQYTDISKRKQGSLKNECS